MPTERTISDHLKQITAATGVSVALTLTLMAGAYHAGMATNRIDTLERETATTVDLLVEVRRLAETMDRRITLLEDRAQRLGKSDDQGQQGQHVDN